MSDYISREAALTELQNPELFNVSPRFLQILRDLPAADVEPVVHGRWEEYIHSRYCGIDEYGEPIYRDVIVYYCSNPKCRRKTVIKENYCPNCGSKMDLEV
nr:MAG TPA: zinc-ribbon containing domain protein [Caudoviricetes sp.]